MGFVTIDSDLDEYAGAISHYYTYLLYFFAFDPGDITFAISPPSDVVVSVGNDTKARLLYRMTKFFVRKIIGKECLEIESSVAEYVVYKKGKWLNKEEEMLRKLREGTIC